MKRYEIRTFYSVVQIGWDFQLLPPLTPAGGPSPSWMCIMSFKNIFFLNKEKEVNTHIHTHVHTYILEYP